MYNMTLVYLVLILTISLKANSSMYENYGKLYNPQDYLEQLPSLSLPYKNNVPIPSVNIPMINPSRVITKVINVVTKYITKNPVCIKVKGKKQPCGYRNNNRKRRNIDQFIRNQYYVIERGGYKNKRGDKMIKGELVGSEFADDFHEVRETPVLEENNNYLIDQRLDQLQGILPYYARIRDYETETITVTKQLSNHRVMATLMVKNCIPRDLQVCPPNFKGKKTNSNRSKRHFKPFVYS
ncbi:hypothetical protein RI129_009162 [Pyrocoelia pectoralis]|uniref:Uncharacterized protein n=1 Tax=Pyrocoelia pectoralis TaxID=417401 RepID=A0AAN7ZED2_9COLE